MKSLLGVLSKAKRFAKNPIALLKIASGETIPRSYECSSLLSLFVRVKKTVVRTDFFSKKSKTFNDQAIFKFAFMLYYLNGEYIY